jgi:2-polyprenyl-3-methyl-5-hydroxy-6-metoxy-1,4-benzoquinol methylase
MLRQIAKEIRRKVFPRRGKLAVGSVADVAAVYDEVFDKDERFDTLDISNTPKLKYVLKYAKGVQGQILDAGCGRGSVLRYMLSNGVDAFGVELSKSACDKYLQGVPHANADIISWAEQGYRYEGLVCTDVLEHIPPDQIHKVLASLAKLAPSGFLGIANHSSIHEGHELHVIQKGRDWWVKQLRDHYRVVEVVPPDADDDVLMGHFKKDVFFFIQVASPK